jgi:hypothetical protein
VIGAHSVESSDVCQLGSALLDGLSNLVTHLKMLSVAKVQARLKDVANTVVPPAQRSSAYLQQYVQAETTKWAGIMKTSGVQQQE